MASEKESSPTATRITRDAPTYSPDPRVTSAAADMAAAVSRPPHAPANVQSQFEATGYAQVLVVLTPEATSVAAAHGGARLATASTGRSALAASSLADLEQCFVVPEAAQDAALAQMRVDSAATRVRKAVRGRGASHSASHSASHAGSEAPTTAAAAASGPLLAQVAASAATPVPRVRVYEHLGVMLGTVDRAGLAAVANDRRVEEVHGMPPISLIRPTHVAAAHRRSGITWGLRALGVPRMWAARLTGKGVLVGHLDTGVDGAHPALAGAIASFAEFDFLGNQVPGAPARDSDEHGTHTAGTIVGRKVGSVQFGVAPEARVASAMVIEFGNVNARILAGMNWIVGQGAHILSMSLGLRGYTPAFLTLVRILRARGVLPVIAVGNEGPGTSRSPGNYVEALSVGASEPLGTVADFSSSQRLSRPLDPIVPDIVAPGVDVLSCIPGRRYAEMSGSSMATPHVAGLAALLLQALMQRNRNAAQPLSSQQMMAAVEDAIFRSCQLPPGMRPERGNRGIPDGPAAYQLLMGKPLPASVALQRKRKPAGKPGRKTGARGGGARPAARKRTAKRGTTARARR